jgi:hypothetical protein
LDKASLFQSPAKLTATLSPAWKNPRQISVPALPDPLTADTKPLEVGTLLKTGGIGTGKGTGLVCPEADGYHYGSIVGDNTRTLVFSSDSAL